MAVVVQRQHPIPNLNNEPRFAWVRIWSKKGRWWWWLVKEVALKSTWVGGGCEMLGGSVVLCATNVELVAVCVRVVKGGGRVVVRG